LASGSLREQIPGEHRLGERRGHADSLTTNLNIAAWADDDVLIAFPRQQLDACPRRPLWQATRQLRDRQLIEPRGIIGRLGPRRRGLLREDGPDTEYPGGQVSQA